MKKYAVGLKNLHYAILNSDDSNGASYQSPVKLSEAVSINVEPNVASARLSGDNRTVATASKFNYVTVTINTTNLPAKDEAALLGKTLGSDGVLRSKGNAPYVAFGYEVTMDDGSSEFWWLLKGKFQEPSRTNNTQGDSIEFQQPSIVGEFIQREYDEEWKFIGNENNTGFVSAETWFDQVYSPAADTTPPTVTVSPADESTGIATTTSVEWTFSEAIMQEDMHDGNFYVIDAAGDEVAGTLSLSTDDQVVTFTPDASLVSATDYTAVASKNVRDLAGNKMVENSVTNFTTA